MSTAAQTIVQRLWNYCSLLRDDGMSYGDYVEQLTYLLFLKMAYERTKPPYNQPSRIPFDRKPASPTHWTERLWVYDLRTNQNFTLRTNPLTRAHLDDFVACYHPENRHQRQESERFRVFSYDELLKRDKVSLDLFWLRDESLEGADALPPPDVLATSIVEDLQAALEEFTAIAEDLGNGVDVSG